MVDVPATHDFCLFLSMANAAPMAGMDTPPFPQDLDPRGLAQQCEQRAHDLHARAWRSDAEREALREATADLLSAVARQLDGGVTRVPVPSARPLTAEEVRALIATRVVHQPLHPTSFEDGDIVG